MIDEKRIKAVAFDLFGTLVKPIAGRAGLLRGMPGIKSSDAREMLMRGQVEVPMHAQVQHAVNGAELYPDALPAIAEARRRGLQVACISNLAQPFVAAVDRLLPDAFDLRVLSCELGHVKPEPEIYSALADGLRLEPGQILVVGDAHHKDFLVPRELGFQALWLDREGRSDGIRSLEEIWR